MLKRTLALLWIVLALPVFTEEGMLPVSELKGMDLNAAGFQLTLDDLYNSNGNGLANAIVKISGCTGSFVSSDGLIITNHHCAFRALQAASNVQHDYVTDGFAASARTAEIPAKGYTVRITERYEDVSDQVLSAINEQMPPAERSRAIERRIKEIEKQAEASNPGIRAEVSEMFLGKTYWLFFYTYLKDVRLVYAPPRSIGEYGGETDNWIWPRHTGDFSFMRVYTGPEGESADYAPDNVPYHPRQFLKVNAAGVNNGDFVFLLGYPGRTYRHRTAHFISYQQDVYMPYVADWYDWQIDLMEKRSAVDREDAIKLAARIKGLANTMKRYRGQMKGIERVGLVQSKKAEELELQRFIQADPERKEEYGNVLRDIGKLYDETRATAPHDLTLRYLTGSPMPLRIATTIVDAVYERAKPDLEREPAYMDRNFEQTKKRLELMAAALTESVDKTILIEMLKRNAALPKEQQVETIRTLLGDNPGDAAIRAYVDNLFQGTQIDHPQTIRDLLTKTPEQLAETDDPLVELALDLYPEMLEEREIRQQRKGRLDELQARLISVKQLFKGTAFIPDANSTFRMTYGHVNGYSPRDAVWYEPITTLTGVMEKNTGQDPFHAPDRLVQLYREKTFGNYAVESLHDVPVALLYDTDTTGGNSGSPVMDAKGQLVGVNFDRAFEATINDYAWSPLYSRSIGVDIRYVLFILDQFSHMDSLLKEMNVQP